MTSEQRNILYIEGKTKTVIVRDGPALRIRQTATADQIIPLRRISQVNSFGCTHWDTEALLACSDTDIMVNFCRQDGTLRATLHGKFNAIAASHLVNRLTDAIKNERRSESLKQWMTNYRDKTTRDCMDRLLQRCWYIEPEKINTHLDVVGKRHMNSRDWSKTRNIMKILVTADIMHKMREDGIDPESNMFKLRNIDLVSAVSTTVFRAIFPALIAHLSRRRLKQQQRDKDIGRFHCTIQSHEALIPDISTCYDEYTIQMHRHLLEST